MTADIVKEPEAAFYEIGLDDNYADTPVLRVEINENDEDYPLAIVAETSDKREIGLVLTDTLIRRIIAEAFVLGLI